MMLSATLQWLLAAGGAVLCCACSAAAASRLYPSAPRTPRAQIEGNAMLWDSSTAEEWLPLPREAVLAPARDVAATAAEEAATREVQRMGQVPDEPGSAGDGRPSRAPQ